MAIQVLDHAGGSRVEPVCVKDLEALGFREIDENKTGVKWVYAIERTNEDGTPFESKLL